MLTKEVIEGLLYISENREILTECLTACHILDEDRDWQPVEHSEFYFLDNFKYCNFLEIIDKQIHVFLIGSRVKGQSYAVLQIEGFNCELLTLSKTELVTYVKDLGKEVDEMYLPELFGQRIIFIKPDYINGLLGNDDFYIFIRKTGHSSGSE